jgi:hypothetical protein
MPRLSAHEVKIAELERVVGKQTMELEFLRRALRGTHAETRDLLGDPDADYFSSDFMLRAQCIDRCTGEIFLGNLR